MGGADGQEHVASFLPGLGLLRSQVGEAFTGDVTTALTISFCDWQLDDISVGTLWPLARLFRFG